MDNSSSGYIVVDNWAESEGATYVNQMACSWTIQVTISASLWPYMVLYFQAPENATIRLVFEEFDLEDWHDKLYLEPPPASMNQKLKLFSLMRNAKWTRTAVL